MMPATMAIMKVHDNDGGHDHDARSGNCHFHRDHGHHDHNDINSKAGLLGIWLSHDQDLPSK